MIEQLSVIVPNGASGGVHEVDVETVTVVEIFESVLSRMSEIARTIRGRGGAPAFLTDKVRGRGREVVFTAVGENPIQGREHIGRGFVAAASGIRRMIGEEHTRILAEAVRPNLGGYALHPADVESLSEPNPPGLGRPLPRPVPHRRR